MLVLSRKVGERLVIGEDIVLVVNRVAGNRVVLAIEAPSSVRIVRGELAPLAEPPSMSPNASEAVTLTMESRPGNKRLDNGATLGSQQLRAACG